MNVLNEVNHRKLEIQTRAGSSRVYQRKVGKIKSTD
ncbi:hypothetical protein E2C01_006080 [Portunus trituberculatus]|uniref:Uncharacterized protein n=1 Tax=Portunus trituberculatus TaxID=210409 RepID=A0A5B7CVY0_PORTR|nr:hypothetical protein [Portunus trituberculatus]